MLERMETLSAPETAARHTAPDDEPNARATREQAARDLDEGRSFHGGKRRDRP